MLISLVTSTSLGTALDVSS